MSWTIYRAKAVADGAVAFFLDHRVSARVAKFTYGTRCATQFDRNDPQHKLRASMAVPRPSGRTVLPNAFSAILTKVKTCYRMLCIGSITDTHIAGHCCIRDEGVQQELHYGGSRPFCMQYDYHGGHMLQR